MILIKGMEMPTSCYDCPLAMQDYTTLFGKNFNRTRNSYACVLTHKAITSTKRNRFCPLVPVPEHGRLIDADALPWIKGRDEKDNPVYMLIKGCVDDLPTIIPADKEGDG